jgi:hypothetical protein
MKKMLRDCLLTVGVSQNQKKHILSKTLPNILSCAWGFQQLREVWTKNFKTSPSKEDDFEMTGDGEGLGEPSPDEDDFEKQMRLANESDKTTVRVSPSQSQVDQVEG